MKKLHVKKINNNYEKNTCVMKLKIRHVKTKYHYLLGYSCDTRVLHKVN